jgi:hypothetical protein
MSGIPTEKMSPILRARQIHRRASALDPTSRLKLDPPRPFTGELPVSASDNRSAASRRLGNASAAVFGGARTRGGADRRRWRWSSAATGRRLASTSPSPGRGNHCPAHTGGEQDLERGDVVCFPAGPAGAHQVTNRSDAPARTLMFSSSRAPAVCVYPDSDLIGVWPDDGENDLVFRRASAVSCSEVQKGSD